MNLGLLLLLVLAFSVASYFIARRRVLGAASGQVSALHSLPGYYGWYAALWCGLPGLVIAIVWVTTAR